MKSVRTERIASRIYEELHIVLWAALLVFVLWFGVMVIPQLPEARARADTQRLHEIEAEHNFYCAKFRMAEGTPGHRQCVLDLQAFRMKVERRMFERLQDFY